jgi:hypothetical protein
MTELQKLADETGLEISVCHLPPGTSKWNKIEHRLFSFISQNWRDKPLISHDVIINLIAAYDNHDRLVGPRRSGSRPVPEGDPGVRPGLRGAADPARRTPRRRNYTLLSRLR